MRSRHCSGECTPNLCSNFFVSSCSGRRYLHSFPTRRSSDRLPELLALLRVRKREVVAALCQADAHRRDRDAPDRKSTRLNSSHVSISYAVFCLKKKRTFEH